jgi:pimeloyl-ACP methyl ester carboxylesterase
MKKPDDATSRHVLVDGRRIEYRPIGAWRPGAPVLVFLHEGLGSVAMWRAFPQRLCADAGLPGLVYSRLGYGRSDPLRGARSADFMHEEATGALPALLAALGIERPVLVGHSDGASIALIHAGRFPGAARAVVALAPHLFVEQVCVDSIAAITAEFGRSDLRERLARYHDDVDGAFHGWSDVWLSAPFAAWNIEAEVAASRCPILAIQGEQDQYGTMRQLDRIAELRPDARLLKLPDCRHSPQFDRPDAVIAAASAFLRDIGIAAAAAQD